MVARSAWLTDRASPGRPENARGRERWPKDRRLPSRVEARRTQLVDVTKKLVNKSRDPKVTRRVRTPVERGQDCRNRNRRDPLAFGDQEGIVAGLKR